MKLDDLINKLMEIRIKKGNIEVCVFDNCVESIIDWLEIKNIELVNGDEEEMVSDLVIINCDRDLSE